MRPTLSDPSSGDIALDPLPDYAAADLPADDFGQAPADLDQDAPARRSKTARKAPPRFLAEPPAPPPAVDLVVCLDCGEGPAPSSDCTHPEVLHLPAASPAQHAAAQRLAHLTRELRTQQRALRRLASDALGRGEATLTRAAPPPGPPPPPPSTRPVPAAATAPRAPHGAAGPLPPTPAPGPREPLTSSPRRPPRSRPRSPPRSDRGPRSARRGFAVAVAKAPRGVLRRPSLPFVCASSPRH